MRERYENFVLKILFYRKGKMHPCHYRNKGSTSRRDVCGELAEPPNIGVNGRHTLLWNILQQTDTKLDQVVLCHLSKKGDKKGKEKKDRVAYARIVDIEESKRLTGLCEITYH